MFVEKYDRKEPAKSEIKKARPIFQLTISFIGYAIDTDVFFMHYAFLLTKIDRWKSSHYLCSLFSAYI